MKRAMTTILFVLLSLLFFSCGLEQNEVSQTWAEMEQKITVATLETNESVNKGPYWIDTQEIGRAHV